MFKKIHSLVKTEQAVDSSCTMKIFVQSNAFYYDNVQPPNATCTLIKKKIVFHLLLLFLDLFIKFSFRIFKLD